MDATDPDGPAIVDNPYDFYRWLRDECPLYWHEPSQEFFVSRFADVQAVATDWQRFSSELPGKSHDHFASMDPPRHDLHRAAIARLFTPRQVSTLEADIRSQCRSLLRRSDLRDGIDLGEAYAALLPSQVITGIVGVPDELREPFRIKALAITQMTGLPAVYQAILKLQAITREAIAGNYPLPPAGILSTLLRNNTSGATEVLSERDIVGICTNLVLAGTDTASNLISSTAVLLAARADVRTEVVNDPSKIGDLVEETLRFESPVQWLRRSARHDTQLHGHHIPAGSAIRLYWGSANRDERTVDHPDQFDINRKNQKHISFGHGLHFCVGASLARMETRLAIETLLDLAPRYRVMESGVHRLRSSMFRGYENVPIQVGRTPETGS